MVSNVAAKTGKTAYYTELHFANGAVELTGAQRQALRGLVNRAAGSGPIVEVKVAAWGDDIASSQRNLADARTDRIESYIRSEYPNLNIVEYNMVDHPNALAAFLNSPEASDRSLEEAGIANVDAPGEHLGRAKAIVFAVLKGN